MKQMYLYMYIHPNVHELVLGSNSKPEDEATNPPNKTSNQTGMMYVCVQTLATLLHVHVL